MTRADLLARLPDTDELVLLEGPEFDRAVIGTVERFGGICAVCYDYDKVIAILKRHQGMSDEEAREWFDFNMIGASMGDHTPVYLTRLAR